MALINYNQIKKVRLKCTEWLFVLISGKLLIEGEIDLVGTIQLFPFNFCHDSSEGFKILLHGLIHQNISISKEKNFTLGAGFPEAVNDLESRICFACTSSHDE